MLFPFYVIGTLETLGLIPISILTIVYLYRGDYPLGLFLLCALAILGYLSSSVVKELWQRRKAFATEIRELF